MAHLGCIGSERLLATLRFSRRWLRSDTHSEAMAQRLCACAERDTTRGDA
jgi:hypothetical protein